MRLFGTCNGEGLIDDVMCMVWVNVPVSSFFVNASVWLNMTASSFGRSAQDSFRSSVRASLSVSPLEVLLTVTEHTMPVIRPRVGSTAKVLQSGVLLSAMRAAAFNDSPILRQRTDSMGLLVVFTAYFSSHESALKAESQATMPELIQQLITRGLPAPVIVDAPKAFLLEQPRETPFGVGERMPSDSAGINTGLVVGLVVGSCVLVTCCCSVFLVYRFARKRKMYDTEQMQINDTEPLRPVMNASVQELCSVHFREQEHTFTNHPQACIQEPSSQLWAPNMYAFEPWRLNSDMHDTHAQGRHTSNVDSHKMDACGNELCTSLGGSVRRQTQHFNGMATLQDPQHQGAQQDREGFIVPQQEQPTIVHVQPQSAILGHPCQPNLSAEVLFTTS
jgi:hypothetical protein